MDGERYDLPCHRGQFPGWKCKFWHHHDGPCGLVPRWWNFSSFARRYRRAS